MNARRLLSTLPALLLTALILSPARGAQPGPALVGALELGGSLALADLTTAWIDGFRHYAPGIRVTVADAGTGAGFAGLINGSEEAVLVALPAGAGQRAAFEARFGYPPTFFPVAMDAVAVYVNDSNPLRRITLAQLDAIYSDTLRCGARAVLETWGALGVGGTLKSRRIQPYGLTANTGAYRLFRKVALCGGDFGPDFQAVAGPDALEAALMQEPAAIGFSSSALRSAGIRALAVARSAASPAVLPDAAAIRSHRYPMSRTLAIAVNLPPSDRPSPALAAFVGYVRSAAGQAIAARAGYVPLDEHGTTQP